MAELSSKILKSLHISRAKIYLDGDPMEYHGAVTIPPISHPVDTFDNISVSGALEVADPYRYNVEGDGEIILESSTINQLIQIHDASKIYGMNIAIAENNYNSTISQIIPIPVNIKINAQFFSVDNGTIQMGAKRDMRAMFKMLSYKVQYSGVTVVNFDFLGSQFELNNVDLLADLTAILGA